jgi:hypothetical protein
MLTHPDNRKVAASASFANPPSIDLTMAGEGFEPSRDDV